MSRIGKALIGALEEAKNKELIALQTSPDVAKLRKDLKLSQQRFAEAYRILTSAPPLLRL